MLIRNRAASRLSGRLERAGRSMLVISICAGFICSCRSIRMYQAAWRLALTTDAAPTLRLRTTAGILRWGILTTACTFRFCSGRCVGLRTIRRRSAATCGFRWGGAFLDESGEYGVETDQPWLPFSGMLQYYSPLPLNITSGVTTVQGTAGRPVVNGVFIGRNVGIGNDFFIP